MKRLSTVSFEAAAYAQTFNPDEKRENFIIVGLPSIGGDAIYGADTTRFGIDLAAGAASFVILVNELNQTRTWAGAGNTG